eukprot:1432932-Amphidinium_carterae.1
MFRRQHPTLPTMWRLDTSMTHEHGRKACRLSSTKGRTRLALAECFLPWWKIFSSYSTILGLLFGQLQGKSGCLQDAALPRAAAAAAVRPLTDKDIPPLQDAASLEAMVSGFVEEARHAAVRTRLMQSCFNSPSNGKNKNVFCISESFSERSHIGEKISERRFLHPSSPDCKAVKGLPCVIIDETSGARRNGRFQLDSGLKSITIGTI